MRLVHLLFSSFISLLFMIELYSRQMFLSIHFKNYFYIFSLLFCYCIIICFYCLYFMNCICFLFNIINLYFNIFLYVYFCSPYSIVFSMCAYMVLFQNQLPKANPRLYFTKSAKYNRRLMFPIFIIYIFY